MSRQMFFDTVFDRQVVVNGFLPNGCIIVQITGGCAEKMQFGGEYAVTVQDFYSDRFTIEEETNG